MSCSSAATTVALSAPGALRSPAALQGVLQLRHAFPVMVMPPAFEQGMDLVED